MADSMSQRLQTSSKKFYLGYLGICICFELVYIYILVGGLEHVLFFHLVGNVIIPTDELIFFRGVGIPPTSTNI